MQLTSSVEWWRPKSGAACDVRNAGAAEQAASHIAHTASPVAYRGLLAFTMVLILAPQEFVPALAPLRPALLAAGVAIVAHLIDRARRPVAWRTPREFAIAGALLVWTVVTLPLSLWPGGSVAYLSD